MKTKHLYLLTASILSFIGCTIGESWVLIPITVISIFSMYRFIELDNKK
jgi:hypothetical protein